MTGPAMDALPFRDRWGEGETAHFEYHCHRSHDSVDAQLWYRDQQVVRILGFETSSDGYKALQDGVLSMTERSELGTPLSYRILFADGFEGLAVEDELYTSAAFFDPSLGPPSADEIASATVSCQDMGC